MTTNFKQQVTAATLASDLPVILGVTCEYAEVTGGPAALVGSQITKGGGGGIRILDQWKAIDGSDSGFKDLPGFSGSGVQPVYTTGVAQLLVESQAADVALVAASGTLTPATVVATDTCEVGGITFTCIDAVPTSIQFALKGTNLLQGIEIARAINANATTSQLVTASAHATTGVVTVSAKYPGAVGNTITLTGHAVTLVASGAGYLAGGKPATDGYCMPTAVISRIVADLARRGLKVELYAVPLGETPTFANFTDHAVLHASFFPSPYFTMHSLV